MERLVIQSDINNIIDVERFIALVCDRWNINNYSATISMSLLQAVENAIVHGNNSDTSKQVVITAEQGRGGVSFVVSDEGPGFDYSSYNSSMPPEGDKGMGIYVMRSLSDKISFSNGGKTVRLDYFVSGIEATYALERIMRLKKYYAPKAVVQV